MPQYLPFAPNLYGPPEAQLVSFMCGGKIRESMGDLSNLSTVLMTDLLLTSIHWLPQAWQVPGREREGGRKKWREEGEEEVNICDLQSCPNSHLLFLKYSCGLPRFKWLYSMPLHGACPSCPVFFT